LITLLTDLFTQLAIEFRRPPLSKHPTVSPSRFLDAIIVYQRFADGVLNGDEVYASWPMAMACSGRGVLR